MSAHWCWGYVLNAAFLIKVLPLFNRKRFVFERLEFLSLIHVEVVDFWCRNNEWKRAVTPLTRWRFTATCHDVSSTKGETVHSVLIWRNLPVSDLIYSALVRLPTAYVPFNFISGPIIVSSKHWASPFIDVISGPEFLPFILLHIIMLCHVIFLNTVFFLTRISIRGTIFRWIRRSTTPAALGRWNTRRT